jgi:O-antigen/teichoic acid export membrane protein
MGRGVATPRSSVEQRRSASVCIGTSGGGRAVRCVRRSGDPGTLPGVRARPPAPLLGSAALIKLPPSRRLARLLPRGRVYRRITTLAGSVVLGQVVIVAISPMLTRLYTPEEFGAYAIVTALVGIAGTVACLRYDAAIPLLPTDQGAGDLTCLCILLALCFAALSLLLVWLVGPWLAAVAATPNLQWLLLLAPAVLVALSVGQTMSYWSVRRGLFRENALSRLVASCSQAAAQLGLGFAGFMASGLVVGYLAGQAVRVVQLALTMPKGDRHLFAGATRDGMLRQARRAWRYPAFSAPSGLLEATTQLLPALLLAILYGPAVAGWFSLGQRLLGLPVRLLGQTTSLVVLAELAQRDARGMYRLFRRASTRFLALGLVGMSPLIVAGPALFALVFGEDWRMAGHMAQLLAPIYITRLMIAPVTKVLDVLGQQKLHLISSSVDGTLMCVVFLSAWQLGLSPLVTLGLYSLGSTSAYTLYFCLTWMTVHRAAHAAIAKEASAE